jgi:probable selenium-dependent hydroxylase accessory protein YqeC
MIKAALEIGEKSLITMVGGGGKTTGLFLLAKELKNSLITSTTKFFAPPLEENIIPVKWPQFTGEPGKIPLVYSQRDGEKLLGIDVDGVEKLKECSLFDHILCEGDGARMKPLKVWKEGEPVIPPSTTHLVINIGSKVFGNRWGESWVHRHHLLPFQNEIIDFSTLIKMAEKGVFNFPGVEGKIFMAINQWDVMGDKVNLRETQEFGEKIKKTVPNLYKVLFLSYEKNQVYYSV